MRWLWTLLSLGALALAGCSDGDTRPTADEFSEWVEETSAVDGLVAECVTAEMYDDLSDEELRDLVALDEGSSDEEWRATPGAEDVAEVSFGCLYP